MTAVAPAHRAAPQMTHTPDPDATLQAEAGVAAAEARPARARLRDQIAENPLLSLFVGLTLALPTFLGTVVVALLIFALGGINDRLDSLGERIDSVESSLGERIDNLEDKMDAGFAAQGAQIVELDRKLTALIAHLNATEAVDAALEHRLLVPDGSPLETEGEPPG